MRKRTSRLWLVAVVLGCAPAGPDTWTTPPDTARDIGRAAHATAATAQAPGAAKEHAGTAIERVDVEDIGGDTGQDTTAPPGFPATDEFADLETACESLVPRLVEREDLRDPILAWCQVRAHASSRNGRVRSRIDGSWIHDRDRPSALAFYRQGVRSGHIDPAKCAHHEVDEGIRRSREAREFPGHWPYGTYCDRGLGDCRPRSPGAMLADVAEEWMSHPPDYERFGTRGPMDNHFATAVRYLGGCFPPEALDRFDVAAAVVIERSEDLCLRLEAKTRSHQSRARNAGIPTACRTYRDIRSIWHPRFWYSRLPSAL